MNNEKYDCFPSQGFRSILLENTKFSILSYSYLNFLMSKGPWLKLRLSDSTLQSNFTVFFLEIYPLDTCVRKFGKNNLLSLSSSISWLSLEVFVLPYFPDVNFCTGISQAWWWSIQKSRPYLCIQTRVEHVFSMSNSKLIQSDLLKVSVIRVLKQLEIRNNLTENIWSKKIAALFGQRWDIMFARNIRQTKPECLWLVFEHNNF